MEGDELIKAAGACCVWQGQEQESDMEPMTLGKLIKELEKADPSAPVQYDFGSFKPTHLASYRGYYNELALGYAEPNGEGITVGDLLPRLRGAIGRVFTGWKGGEYLMDEETEVWAANEGDVTGTAIVGVRAANWRVVLVTELID